MLNLALWLSWASQWRTGTFQEAWNHARLLEEDNGKVHVVAVIVFGDLHRE